VRTLAKTELFTYACADRQSIAHFACTLDEKLDRRLSMRSSGDKFDRLIDPGSLTGKFYARLSDTK